MNIDIYGAPTIMRRVFKKELKKHNLNFNKDILSLDNINPKTEILGVFVDSKIDKKILKKLKKLKLIVTLSTGYDHIDLKSCNKKKIPVCNVPSYGENTVAQHAVALILALSRKLFDSVKHVKEGGFDYHGLRGFDLQNKTIGVIGTGHIGQHVIKMLSGFDVNIVAYDKFGNKDLAKKYNFKYVSLKKLLNTSDIVTIHVPLFKETTHLINKTRVKQMKKNSYLINTARGAIVDAKALLYGLDSGIIAGAGLDTFEEENILQHNEELLGSQLSKDELEMIAINQKIIDHPKTIVTPHSAFNSKEALERIANTTVNTINAFSDKQSLDNVLCK